VQYPQQLSLGVAHRWISSIDATPGSFTSQESSNLIWGGFKYLEGYEFLLVRKLSVSRNRLIRSCPNNIRPVPFMAALDRDAPFTFQFRRTHQSDGVTEPDLRKRRSVRLVGFGADC